MNRILVIRGGPIGDVILTLPVLKALRDAYPRAHLRYTRLQAYRGARRKSVLRASCPFNRVRSALQFLCKEFAAVDRTHTLFREFDLIISYLYDPDGIFENNLRRCGVKQLIRGPAKIDNHEHAMRQLARPLEQLGLRVDDLAARIFPSDADRNAVEKLLGRFSEAARRLSSGQRKRTKNWPLENWIDIGNHLLDSNDLHESLVIVSGEADQDRVRPLRAIWKNERARFASNFPLPELAALFQDAIFSDTTAEFPILLQPQGKLHFAFRSDRSGCLGTDEQKCNRSSCTERESQRYWNRRGRSSCEEALCRREAMQ
jgi:heptosyltransferase-2